MVKKTLIFLLFFIFLATGLYAQKEVRILVHKDPEFHHDWNDVLENQLIPFKKIRVTNTSATTALNDFQVKFTFDPSSDPEFFQKCGANGENVGIWTEDGVRLPSWIEKWSSTSATIWFKIDSIPAGGSKTYRFYCNSSKKGNNNPDEVFELFDDFNDQSFDTSKWGLKWYSAPNEFSTMTPDPSSASTWRWDEGISHPGKLTFYNNHCKRVDIYTKKTFTGDYKAIVKFIRIKDIGNIWGARFADPEDLSLIAQVWVNDNLGHTYAKFLGDSTNSEFSPIPDSNEHFYEILKIGNLFKVKTSWGVQAAKEISSPKNTFRFVLIDENWDVQSSSNYVAIDEVRIMKIVDSEPIVSFE